MQKKIFGGFVVFLIGVLIFASCAKDTVKPPQSTVDTTQKVSFESDIQPIFTSSCLGSLCHSGSAAPNLTVGKAYNDLISGGFLSPDNVNICDDCWDMIEHLQDDMSEIHSDADPGL